MVRRRKLVIVDPSLKDFVGHHFEYDKAISAAAVDAGFDVSIFAHTGLVEPVRLSLSAVGVFSRDIWAPYPREIGLSAPAALRAANLEFLRELNAATRGVPPLQPGDLVFGHMITQRQLLGWAQFVSALPGDGAPTTALLLRYQSEIYECEACGEAFRILEVQARVKPVRLLSDSERLSSQIRRLTSLSVETVPIPHTGGIQPFTDARHGRGGPITVVSLGNARDEKGLLEIFQAVRILEAAGAAAEFEFVLQVNDPDKVTKPAIAAFAKENHANVALLSDAMDSAGYYRLLHSADVVAVPYWREIYEARTSGIFLEALAAAKPVLCTEDSWMSDQLRVAGAGLEVKNRNPMDLVSKMRRLQADYDRILAGARSTQDKWLAIHNPAAAFRAILGSVIPNPRATRSRAALLYPWGDARERNAGASVRVNHLARFLSTRFDEIRLMQNADHGREMHRGLRMEAHAFDEFLSKDWRIRFLKWVCTRLFRTKGDELHFLMHVGGILDRRLDRRIRELVRWADVVFLEYSYWARTAARICREEAVPLIVTAHDVLGHQVMNSRILRFATEWIETRWLRSAETVVVMSEDDKTWFEAKGIPTAVIAHPIVVQSPPLLPALDTSSLLHGAFGIPAGSAHIFLFVGSEYGPNIAAAKKISSLSADFAKAYPNSMVRFVVAGGCHAESSDGLFTALGKVSTFQLRLLYENSTAVLIPLEFGTGASLKTIEALAYGKPVVGTSIAFRGLPIRNEIDCLIVNDLTQWPAVLEKLRQDLAHQISLGSRARSFAASYDIDSTFTGYLELLPKWEHHSIAHAAAAMESGNLDYLQWIAAEALRTNQLHLVGAAVEQILHRLPNDPIALSCQIELQKRKPSKNAERVETMIARALTSGGDPIALLEHRSSYRRNHGDVAGAQEDLARIVAYCNGEAWTTDGELQLRGRLWKEFHSGNRTWVGDVCHAIRHVHGGTLSADYVYLLAHCLMDRKDDLPEALAYFEQALDDGFPGFWPHTHRATLLYDMGRICESLPEWSLAASCASSDAELKHAVNVAEAQLWQLHQSGRHADAVAGARSLLQWWSDGATAYYLLAESLREVGAAADTVVEALEAAGVHGYDQAWLTLSKARLRLREGDDVPALKGLAEARSAAKNDWIVNYVNDAIEGKLWALWETSDVDAARAHAELVLRALPGHADAKYILARIGLRDSPIASSRALARPDVGEKRSGQEWWNENGATCFTSDELCQVFIQSSPSVREKMRESVQERLWIAFNAKQYSLVLALTQKISAAVPDFAVARYLCAECIQLLNGDLDQAIVHYDAALTCGFDSYWCLFNRAQAKRKIGNVEGAAMDVWQAANAAASADLRRRAEDAVRDLEREPPIGCQERP